jgi:8-oxo-dGTP pyrophosphatase MutT (NUDIX family)
MMARPKQAHMPRKSERRQQYAALPVRRMEDGKVEVLLLTSRGTGRWIIPKGWPMRKLSPGAAAAREAYEEAGVEGTIQPDLPVGRYHYTKRLDVGGETEILVEVFLLRVERQLAEWPEQAERETRWLKPEEAAGLVAEPELAALLRSAQAFAEGPGS